MPGADDHLSPADAAAAMRSWPRRYRSELLPVDDPEVEARAVVMGPGGVSATDLAADTVRSLTVLERAVHDIRVGSDPVLHPAVLDRAARHWGAAVPESPGSVLAQLDERAESFAATIEATDASEWTRTARCGNASITAFDVVREAVDTAASNLRTMTALLGSLD